MDRQERRSGPVTTRAASTSKISTTNAAPTVTEPEDITRLIVEVLRRPARPVATGCPCGCWYGLHECLRRVDDFAALYRAKVDGQRRAEGRAA